MDTTQFDIISDRVRHVLTREFLFISGAPKSGTTWLQKALDAHPNIVCSGEGHFYNVLVSALGQIMDYYYKQLEKVDAQVYQGKPYYAPLAEEQHQFIAQSMVALMMGQRPIADGVRYVGDKTPANALCMNELSRFFPGACFIHIVRDPRDVVVSTLKHGERVAIEIKDRNQHIQTISERWVEYNQKAFLFSEKSAGQFHWLRYRDLLHDFEKTFAALLQFLGLERSTDILKTCKEASDFKALSGGREPGREDNSSFYRKGVWGDWKNTLTSEEVQIIYASCGPLLEKLGFMDEPCNENDSSIKPGNSSKGSEPVQLQYTAK